MPVRGAFRLLSRGAPDVAAGLLGRLFMRPPPTRPLRPHEERAFAEGATDTLTVDGRVVRAWRWGEGPRRALLVHGWGGRAAQLLPYLDPLRDRGFQVWTFDAPAHGQSGGTALVLPQMARMLLALADRIGGLDAVVAHSFGAAATALASRERPLAARLALLAPPGDVRHFSRLFVGALGGDGRVHDRMMERFERRHRVRFASLRADAVAMEQPASTLIVHDAGDEAVPFEHAEWLHRAWSGARLLRTDGLGHKGVLRDSEVVRAVVTHLAAEAA